MLKYESRSVMYAVRLLANGSRLGFSRRVEKKSRIFFLWIRLILSCNEINFVKQNGTGWILNIYLCKLTRFCYNSCRKTFFIAIFYVLEMIEHVKYLLFLLLDRSCGYKENFSNI